MNFGLLILTFLKTLAKDNKCEKVCGPKFKNG